MLLEVCCSGLQNLLELVELTQASARIITAPKHFLNEVSLPAPKP